MNRVLIVNPPLSVGPECIDSPAFAGYPAWSLARALGAAGVPVELLDTFRLRGPRRTTSGRIAIGRLPSSAELDRPGRFDLTVVNYSSFHRAGGPPVLLLKLLPALAARCRTLFLADLYDGTTHHLCEPWTGLAGRLPKGIRLLPAGEVAPVFELAGAKMPEVPWQLAGPVFDRRLPELFRACAAAGLVRDQAGAERLHPYLATTGCRGRCSFCPAAATAWRHKPLPRIREELTALAALGVERLVVLDQHANQQRRFFDGFLLAVADTGLKLHFANGIGLARIDRSTAEQLAPLVDTIHLSPETCDPAVLRRLGKPHTAAAAEHGLGLLSSAGISVQAHWLIDTPGETPVETNRTLACAWDAQLRHGAVPRLQRYVPASELRTPARPGHAPYDRFDPAACADPDRRLAAGNFAYKLGRQDERKLIVNVSYRCNNRCLFCSVDDRPRTDGPLETQLRFIRESAAAGVRLLDLDGGEPLLHPNLFRLLRTAVECGYDRISLTTNGRLLAYEEIIRRLCRVPGLALLVSLHSHDQDTHDRLTRVPGSHDQTLAGLKTAARLLGDVGVNMTLTSANWRDVPAVLELAREAGARSFSIQYYTPFGRPDRRLTPPDECAGPLREAVRSAGILQVNLVNFVYCLAPDLADSMRGDWCKAERRMLFCDGRVVNLADFLAGRRYKDGRCAGCPYDCLCGGFWDYE